jgi:hypothetical protein
MAAKPTTGMPAGDARREQERENADALAERIETETPEGGAINPNVFRIENEIAQHFNELEVSHADPAYRYAWVCTKANGVMVTSKQALRVRDASGYMQPCWEIVKGDMAEARESRDETGLRRIGDVILMRCRRDRFALLQQAEAHKREMRKASVDSNLIAMGEEARRRGHGVIVRVDSNLADPKVRAYAQRAAAQGIARDKFDEMIRNGEIPGLQPEDSALLAKQAAALMEKRRQAAEAGR